MALSRRNTLIGIGTVAAGAGVIGASGAFTAVDADREISVESAGDADANVVIEVNEEMEGLTDGGDDVVELDFDGLNQNAVTSYDSALLVTPQDGSGPAYDVSVSVTDGGGILVAEVADGTGSDLSDGDTAEINITIDLTDGDAEELDENAEITISVDEA